MIKLSWLSTSFRGFRSLYVVLRKPVLQVWMTYVASPMTSARVTVQISYLNLFRLYIVQGVVACAFIFCNGHWPVLEMIVKHKKTCKTLCVYTCSVYTQQRQWPIVHRYYYLNSSYNRATKFTYSRFREYLLCQLSDTAPSVARNSSRSYANTVSPTKREYYACIDWAPRRVCTIFSEFPSPIYVSTI